MRRSSAPSQLTKRNSFCSPFVNSSKRICTISDNDSKVQLPVNSTNSLLTLVKKSKENSAVSQTVNDDDSISKKTLHNHGERQLKEENTTNENESYTKYYSVLWCKLSTKKHKKWEGDAVIIVNERTVILKDMEGKIIGKGSGYKFKDLADLQDGNSLVVGSKEIEIQGPISSENYRSGRCFLNVDSSVDVSLTYTVRPKPKPFRLPFRDLQNYQPQKTSDSALHNPFDPDALVIPRPSLQHQWKYNQESLPVVDVVVDPYLSKNLRPHQCSGVVFLYECISGMKVFDKFGAILADEMGLGKTLQCITVIWTVLKQGPYGGKPLCNKVLIVTPSSLTCAWGAEFKKWLGPQRISVYIVDQNNKIEGFMKQRQSSVMIISYDMTIRNFEAITKIKFDLLLCDEGHRLKNSNIKTSSLLNSLNIKRRILLTGTPLQNELEEFHALLEFVNPGTFGSSSSFRRIYEDPILASKQPCASQETIEIGNERTAELSHLFSQFTLRRTQELIRRYLPSKSEFVVFCRPSETQVEQYVNILNNQFVQDSLMGTDLKQHLSVILMLRKICNHPLLLERVETDGDYELGNINCIESRVSNCNAYMEDDSGKLAVVSCILWCLSEAANEKIVLVSNYTTTLDMLETLCKRYNYSFLRLDGSTPVSKRNSIVQRFNDPSCEDFVFLLSAKAGGVGLNLIGASRILLYDIDWNPATDLQAMSRVWRDGQKRKVFVYRLLLAGSIEEKIYQRQICKQGLSSTIVDSKESLRSHFTKEDLKDLLSFHPENACLTHELLNCKCNLSGETPKEEKEQRERACQLIGGHNVNSTVLEKSAKNTSMDELQKWQHFSTPFISGMINDLYLESSQDFITFIFRNENQLQ